MLTMQKSHLVRIRKKFRLFYNYLVILVYTLLIKRLLYGIFKLVNMMKKKVKDKEKLSLEDKKKLGSKFCRRFILWICILAIGVVRKSLQNDTFYTIKIGELILNNGIDMMDHFSFHAGLAYTYPHWLYDVIIYMIYHLMGIKGMYISSIVFLMILLFVVFKTNVFVSKSKTVAAFGTFICTLAISGFVTARAQLISFILFALEIFFIENFLEKKKNKYLGGLLLISLILCNIHVAVWPFYFIIYLPYLAEYVVAVIKKKIKKKNKFLLFLDKKLDIQENDGIKYLFLIMILSLFTGLMTPIGDTPYTYLIKTMMGNSQKYIQEHQMLSWIDSPFTIIIAGETLFLALISKIKLRDLFMICGLVLMSVMSIRHLSLLALIGTICFSRVFAMFLDNFNFDVDGTLLNFFNKRVVIFASYAFVILLASVMFYQQTKKEYVNEEFYPVKATKYIKENIDISKARIFNDYNFGSYLLFYDIPVFIDSRADLYTKQFSGFNYDIFDDYEFIVGNYQEKFDFYNITHILIYKKNNPLYMTLKTNNNYNNLYEDEYFVFYERLN